MGYDLHLTRADDWVDAESNPIPEALWDSVARARLSSSDQSAAEGGQPIYQLEGSGGSPTLQWQRGAVTVWGATDDHVDQLVGLAEALEAHVIGDDGELYPHGAQGRSSASASRDPAEAQMRRSTITDDLPLRERVQTFLPMTRSELARSSAFLAFVAFGMLYSFTAGSDVLPLIIGTAAAAGSVVTLVKLIGATHRVP